MDLSSVASFPCTGTTNFLHELHQLNGTTHTGTWLKSSFTSFMGCQQSRRNINFRTSCTRYMERISEHGVPAPVASATGRIPEHGLPSPVASVRHSEALLPVRVASVKGAHTGTCEIPPPVASVSCTGTSFASCTICKLYRNTNSLRQLHRLAVPQHKLPSPVASAGCTATKLPSPVASVGCTATQTRNANFLRQWHRLDLPQHQLPLPVASSIS